MNRTAFKDWYIGLFNAEERLYFTNGPAHVVIDDNNNDDGFIRLYMGELRQLASAPETCALVTTDGLTPGECIKWIGEIYILLEKMLDYPEDDNG